MNNMEKILFVTDAWAPQVNGVTRVQDAHIKGLRERGYEVAVIEPGQFKAMPMPMYPEIRLALFPRRRVAKVIRGFQPDAVHIQTEGPLGWAAQAECLKRGIPFTTWYHTKFQLYVDVRFRGLLGPVHAWIRRFHSKANRTMISTESLKKELEEAGFKNLVVVPLGIDTELFTRNPKPSVSPLPKPVFVFFSRLAPEKSPEDFLKLKLPGTKLVIGDGPDRAKLEEKYGKENKFIGYKHGQELVDWLSICDVFIFPSRTETFGLVVIEALACGIPVAAYDVMGPHDIITEGKDGYLGEDLRESALKCLELSAADCRKKAEQYSWEHSTEEFLKNLLFVR
jgi:glycosyltransferase involved in cell wall biosynthesis